MGYCNKDEFKKDYEAAAKLAEAKYGDFYKEVDVELAWNAYSNAAKKTDAANSVLGLMIFGRHVASMKSEVARLADSANTDRLKTIEEKDAKLKEAWYIPSVYRKYKTRQRYVKSIAQLGRDKLTIPASIETDKDKPMMSNFGMVNNQVSGSILLMGSANWNLTINDCWLLGAVHSHLPFYPASAVCKANIFDQKHVLSITGRELFGLALFGYRQVISDFPELGSAFEVGNVKKADDATLLTYQTTMEMLTESAAKKTFTDAGFRISEVGL